MKRVQLQKLTLANFKGVRSLEVDFNTDGITRISGANSSGKTTIFDAFTWCLFGKDSKDRTDFDIKTIDKVTGEPIHKLTHEVQADLIVDGVPVSIKRTLKEKWVKKRGEAEEKLQGHEIQRYYNDVPMLAGDFDDKVRENIMTEEVFKAVTSPTYFLSMRKDDQRTALIKMAGEPANEDIAQGNKSFEKLLSDLNGKTIAEREAELRSKISRVKGELKGLPERIDEATRAIPTDLPDSTALQSELKEQEQELANLQSQKEQVSERFKEIGMAKLKMQGEIIGKRSQLQNEKHKLLQLLHADFYKQQEAQQELARTLQGKKKRLSELPAEIALQKRLQEDKLARRQELRDQFQSTKQQRKMDDIEVACPACHRPYAPEEIEARQEEARKALLQLIANQQHDINERGKQVAKDLEGITEHLIRLEEAQAKLSHEILELEEDDLLKLNLTEPPAVAELSSPKYDRLTKEIEELEQAMAGLKDPQSEAYERELEEKRKQAQEKRDQIITLLSDIRRANAQTDRVEQLKRENEKLNAELAKLEGEEITIKEFQREKVNKIEDKINALFEVVKWKLFKEQLNGGWAEECEPLIDNVPYSSANNASRINAGIDIASTIAVEQKVIAPIFIDNAEAVNEILDTGSQQIHLVVTNGKKLKIEHV